ncbi:MAG: diaminopimelate epimerase [Gemmatimonadaceae bacterium]
MGLGLGFWKMTGSGNDFVFLDARGAPIEAIPTGEAIRQWCARGTGIGADGVVVLTAADGAGARMLYFNSDGSRAALCGNAALCTTRLLAELGADPKDISFHTDAGLIRARMVEGEPEIDLHPVGRVQPKAPIGLAAGEERIGFAVAGVPHLAVLLGAESDEPDVLGRGRQLRNDPSLTEGANVNFLRPLDGEVWGIRTYERGVEGETLACGTGVVASAALLTAWGLGHGPIVFRTRSGRSLTVGMQPAGAVGAPSLRGEGRIVFRGEMAR